MIAVIDYKAGNAPSVLRAVEKLGREASFARTAQDIARATHIILPGVGSAGATMDSLRAMDLLGALEEAVLQKKTPFLGICVGMQVLFEHSQEDDAPCLGWLKGSVVKFDAARVRVPQMGWNAVRFQGGVPFAPKEDYFYFVNSYYVVPQNPSDVWGVADYGAAFCAAVHKDNL